MFDLSITNMLIDHLLVYVHGRILDNSFYIHGSLCTVIIFVSAPCLVEMTSDMEQFSVSIYIF